MKVAKDCINTNDIDTIATKNIDLHL